MLKLFGIVSQVIAVIVALVNIVERPGDGAAKRAEVVRFALEFVDKHLKLPAWADNLFRRESFVGWLVDVIVWAANSFGFFTSTETPGNA